MIQPIGRVDDNTVIGPALDVQVTLQRGRCCIEINSNALRIESTVSWVHQPRIGQIRDTAFGRKQELNEYVYQFTDGS